MALLTRSACRCFAFLTCLLAAAPSRAQETSRDAPDRVEWRTGADLQKQLASTSSVQWREAELRQRLHNLTAVHRVAVFLDRRIDPDQQIDFSMTGVTLEDLLSEVAQRVGARTARIGSVIYVGPPRTAGLLSAIAPQRRKDIGRHGALARVRPQPWSWEELAEPRQLLIDLAQRHRLPIVNPEAVPHDLWPAADLPPLELADQLTLLLAGFDLTFELSADGASLRLAPLPTDVEYEQTYASGNAEQAVVALKREFPGIIVRRAGSRLVVRGKYEDHERIARRVQGEAALATGAADANTRYTLTVMNQSAGTVATTVARRLGKQLRCSASVREKLTQKMSLTVKDASLEELMQQTLEPLGLTYRLTNEAMEVIEK